MTTCLALPPDHVHAPADRMEHFTDPDLRDRLSLPTWRTRSSTCTADRSRVRTRRTVGGRNHAHPRSVACGPRPPSSHPAGVARTSDLAGRLGVMGPSVTARVQELAAAGLVRYVPRKGACHRRGRGRAVEAAARLRLIEFSGEVLRLPAADLTREAELIARFITDRDDSDHQILR